MAQHAPITIILEDTDSSDELSTPPPPSPPSPPASLTPSSTQTADVTTTRMQVKGPVTQCRPAPSTSALFIPPRRGTGPAAASPPSVAARPLTPSTSAGTPVSTPSTPQLPPALVTQIEAVRSRPRTDEVLEIDDLWVQRLEGIISTTTDGSKKDHYRQLQARLPKIVLQPLPDGQYRYVPPCYECIKRGIECVLEKKPQGKAGRACADCKAHHNMCNGGGMVPFSLKVSELEAYMDEFGFAKPACAVSDAPQNGKRVATESVERQDSKPAKQQKRMVNVAIKSIGPGVGPGAGARVAAAPSRSTTTAPSKPTPVSITPVSTQAPRSGGGRPATSNAPRPVNWRNVSSSQSCVHLCDVLDSNLEYFEELEMRLASTRAAITSLRFKSTEFFADPAEAHDILHRAPRSVDRLSSIITAMASMDGLRRAIDDFHGVAEPARREPQGRSKGS